MGLMHMYRTVHPTAADYTFFSNAHGKISRVDHAVSHKTDLSKFRNTEIISTIFSEHNGIILEISNKRKVRSTNCGSQITYF